MDDDIEIIESKIEEVKWKLKKEISKLKVLMYSLFILNFAEINILISKNTYSLILLAFAMSQAIALALFFFLEGILSKDK